jgi:UPF0042 nucleotide-binding protein
MTDNPSERAAPGTPDIVIITGMSGAGRSTAAKSLEDLGWFVVDNLPPALLTTMLDLADRASLAGIAAIVDVRSRAFSTDLKSAVSALGSRGVSPHVLFLEASDPVLVQRFENVRRPHPMQGAGTILDGISAERELLREIRGDSDIVLDTSALNVHELRSRMHGYFCPTRTGSPSCARSAAWTRPCATTCSTSPPRRPSSPRTWRCSRFRWPASSARASAT